jgi:type IV pilus assembly protein PilQ
MRKIILLIFFICLWKTVSYSQTGSEELKFIKQINQNKTSLPKNNQIILKGSDSTDFRMPVNDKSVQIEDSAIIYSKQIKVQATLFELNTDKLKERGVNWQGIISKPGLELNSNYKSLPKSTTNNFDYSLSFRLEGDVGRFAGFSDALFKFLEDENLGKLESKLSVIVRNNRSARMQVGSDFSIKQKDFAGNVMDAFYPTGTIIEVNPRILNFDTVKCALLKVNIERSYPVPGEISTEVKKTNASSEVILRDEKKLLLADCYIPSMKLNVMGSPFLRIYQGGYWV